MTSMSPLAQPLELSMRTPMKAKLKNPLSSRPWRLAGSGVHADFAVGRIVGLSDFATAFPITRASVGKAADAAGNFFDYAAHVLRRTNMGLKIEESRTNSLRNNGNIGAVIGIFGSGGSLPTNWTIFAGNGLATHIVSLGTINGLNRTRIRFVGTATGTFYVLAFDNPGPTAAVGEIWVQSMLAAIAAGDMNGIVSLNLNIRQTGGAGGTTDVPFGALTAVPSRQVASRTMLTGTTNVVPAFYMQTTNGAAIDITLDFITPQIELASFPAATSPIDTPNVIASRAADSITMPVGHLSFAQGGVFMEWREGMGPISAVRFLFSMRLDGSNYIRAYIATTTGRVWFEIAVAGVQQTTTLFSTNVVAAGGVYKIAVAWESGRFAMRLSSALGSPANVMTGAPPTGTPVTWIGCNNASGLLGGDVLQLATFPAAPSDAALAAMVA